MDKFSRDLSAEVRDKGVFVQTVHPGFVVTNMSKIKRSSMTAPTPDVYAESTLNTLGLEYRTAGYWFHKIQVLKIHVLIDLNVNFLVVVVLLGGDRSVLLLGHHGEANHDFHGRISEEGLAEGQQVKLDTYCIQKVKINSVYRIQYPF